jgi:hypothetical protein
LFDLSDFPTVIGLIAPPRIITFFLLSSLLPIPQELQIPTATLVALALPIYNDFLLPLQSAAIGALNLYNPHKAAAFPMSCSNTLPFSLL